MIPNHAPIAAVYHHANATGSRDGKLFSRPVVAWAGNNSDALVPGGKSKLAPASRTTADVVFLGLWYGTWTPTYDQMHGLLPKEAREKIFVTVRQLTDGSWLAFRTINGLTLAVADTLEEVRAALKDHHLNCFVENVLPLNPDPRIDKG